jgi:hypothetical protein
VLALSAFSALSTGRASPLERRNMTNLEAKAYALAESISPYLGQPTTPPIKWRQEGDELVVILADGRKVRAPLVELQPKSAPQVLSIVERDVIYTASVSRKKPISPSTPANRTFSRKNK